MQAATCIQQAVPVQLGHQGAALRDLAWGQRGPGPAASGIPCSVDPPSPRLRAPAHQATTHSQAQRGLEAAGDTRRGRSLQLQLAALWQSHSTAISLAAGLGVAWVLYSASLGAGSMAWDVSSPGRRYGFAAASLALSALLAQWVRSRNRVSGWAGRCWATSGEKHCGCGR